MTAGSSVLDERVRQVYGALGEPVVLRKDLAGSIPALARVPRYVAEFLLATRPADKADPRRVADYVAARHPAPSERQLWLHRLVERGELSVLDRIEVRVDVARGVEWASVPSLDLTRVRVSPRLTRRHPGLLTGGLWGLGQLVREPFQDGPVRLAAFHPVEVSVRLDPYLESRHYFTTAQWIDLLITSAGYDPAAAVADLPPGAPRLRRRLLLLARLLPLVESGYNLLELGPKNTGKTYLLRSLSPQVFLMSGSRASPATLFANLSTRTPGILAQRKVVVFDEVARMRLGSDDSVATLKDFMESGRFSRGSHELRSDCALAFVGNIDVEGCRPARHYRHLLEPLPEELRDSAFADRLHAFIPGWELPKLARDALARGVGFVSDYFGAILLALRDHPYADAYARLTSSRAPAPGMTRRDERAVEATARGLLKLVFPLGAEGSDPRVVDAILALAGELRQRVHLQLTRLSPGEFSPRSVGFEGLETHAAPDLSPAADPVPAAPRLPAPGEAYYLDELRTGEDRGGRLLLVEASVIAAQRGLKIRGRPGTGTVDALTTAHSFLVAHLGALGLPADWLSERAMALTVVGGDVADEGSVGLPALLAMVSALRGTASSRPVAAVGDVSLHGRLGFPADLSLRLSALTLGAPALLVLPAAARTEALIAAVPPEATPVFVEDLRAALGIA